ncbi:hypothetical protein [Algoriphagus formosus]
MKTEIILTIFQIGLGKALDLWVEYLKRWSERFEGRDLHLAKI